MDGKYCSVVNQYENGDAQKQCDQFEIFKKCSVRGRMEDESEEGVGTAGGLNAIPCDRKFE